MTMIKNSNEHIPCTWCDRDALPHTDPPVCELHKDKKLDKQASEKKDVKSLKEILNG